MVDTKRRLRTMHIANTPIWDMGKGKGRISTYLPLKTFCDRGHGVWYLTDSKKHEDGNLDGINIKKIRTFIRTLDKHRLMSVKYIGPAIHYVHRPFSILAFIIAATIQGLRFACRYKPDVIYAHGHFPVIPAFILSKLTRSKYVLRSYGGIGGEKKVFYLPMMKVPANLYILVNDGTSARQLAERYGVSVSKICFWVNGNDTNWLDVALDYEFKSSLLEDSEKLVLTLSRLARHKQVDIFIKAIPEVTKTYKNVKFVIVGDGECREELEDLVKDLNISDYVRFEGAVEHSQVAKYMNACDIFVSTNFYSSICNPVIEAMTCGKAVMALNTGATRDFIKDDYNGVLVEVDEVDRLPGLIVSLLRDDERRERIGRNAERFMIDNWPTWEQRVNMEVEIIEALCSNDSRKLAPIKEKADRILDMTRWGK